jgi:hypothetical protein
MKYTFSEQKQRFLFGKRKKFSVRRSFVHAWTKRSDKLNFFRGTAANNCILHITTSILFVVGANCVRPKISFTYTVILSRPLSFLKSQSSRIRQKTAAILI